MRSGRRAWRRCAGLRERACHRAAVEAASFCQERCSYTKKESS